MTRGTPKRSKARKRRPPQAQIEHQTRPSVSAAHPWAALTDVKSGARTASWQTAENYAPRVHWQWPVRAAGAFLLALATTPAGVSGAVLLLPIQLSVLHVPSPAVTPTNLLFNVASTPGALLRFAGEKRLRGPLAGLLLAGTLPGVIAGAVIRVQLLSDSRSFTYLAAGVLLPLGLWLILASQTRARERPQTTPRLRAIIWLLSLLVGTVGGIYGIGGGSLLAPILIATASRL